MEYCDDSDLFQRISNLKKKDQAFDEREIWNVLGQVAKGLRELHANKIFHRDMKSANIFLNKNGSVKVGDMNVSKVAPKGLLYTQTGTPYYASPEVWKDLPYSNKSDIWSLGCIVYEMCALKPPFRAESMEGLYKKVLRGVPERIPGGYSRELAEVIRSMLQVKPGLRPSCEELLSSPSLQKHFDEKFRFERSQAELPTSLLHTIRMPENVGSLSVLLPPSNYDPMRLSRGFFTVPSLRLLPESTDPEKLPPLLRRGPAEARRHRRGIAGSEHDNVKENLKNPNDLNVYLPRIAPPKPHAPERNLRARATRNLKLEPIFRP